MMSWLAKLLRTVRRGLTKGAMRMRVIVDDSDLAKIQDVLLRAEQYHRLRDQMKAMANSPAPLHAIRGHASALTTELHVAAKLMAQIVLEEVK